MATTSSAVGRKILTMIYVVDFDARAVLLGHKARGFGAGKWNGFGGKVDPTDASILAGAARELEEESGLRVKSLNVLHRVGVNYYEYPQELQSKLFEVHIYLASLHDTVGSIQESEEMTPIKMWPFGDVPFDQMWADDPFWLPMLLDRLAAGQREMAHFTGFYKFDSYETVSQTPQPVVVWGSASELKSNSPADTEA